MRCVQATRLHVFICAVVVVVVADIILVAMMLAFAFAGTIGVLVGGTYDVCLCVAANITSVARELIERVQSLCTRTTQVHMLTYIEYI